MLANEVLALSTLNAQSKGWTYESVTVPSDNEVATMYPQLIVPRRLRFNFQVRWCKSSGACRDTGRWLVASLGAKHVSDNDADTTSATAWQPHRTAPKLPEHGAVWDRPRNEIQTP